MSVRKPTNAIALTLGIAAMTWFPSIALASYDSAFPRQWALPTIGAPEAWGSTTGTDVLIGIVDTGVDLDHEDLVGKVVAHTSCIGSDGEPARCGGSGQDDNGHGTHVAGIAAAAKDNGTGIAGVAPDAKLVVAKVLDSDGRGSIDDIVAGIQWVVDHGAQVVNLSLGGNAVMTSLFGTGLAEGIDYAWSRGAVPVIASGNENLLGLGVGSQQYGELDALVVGATGPGDEVASYSSPTGNAKWSLVAPGGAGVGDDANDVYSTYWVRGRQSQYTYLAGTSMATPHVAGAVALLLDQGSSPEQAVTRLLDNADASISCGTGSPTCRGRLDVADAIKAGVRQPIQPF